jgi:hypothetical protein
MHANREPGVGIGSARRSQRFGSAPGGVNDRISEFLAWPSNTARFNQNEVPAIRSTERDANAARPA